MPTTPLPTFPQFGRYVCLDGSARVSVEHDGFTITARVLHDDDASPPWEREDGHGPVSDWTTCDKKPGERVISTDRYHKRFYDFAEAVKIAKRDGWGVPDVDTTGMSKAQIAQLAAEHDLRLLQAWCDDEWHYCGVVLSVSRAGVTLDDHAASLWSIETNYPGSDNSYLSEVADELLPEALDVARAVLAKIKAA